MKYLAALFLTAAFFCLTSINAHAQHTVYFDAEYKPATAAAHEYKRVFKYGSQILTPNIGTDFYGGMILNTKPSGLHTCSVTDYYKTGEAALIGKVTAIDVGCTQTGGFEGQVVLYYKDGTLKRKETWKSGKRHGTMVFYDQAGEETKRAEYVNGNPLENAKFTAPPDSPVTGTWKYQEYYNNDPNTFLTRTSTYIYSPNGIVESIHKTRGSDSSVKGNWKYTPKNAASGILEEYQGDELVERGAVKWLSRDRLQYTVTFSPNSDAIGRQVVWVRQ